ncbi:hypothetical protein [Bradyrhizobium sp. JR3.5]
MAPVGASSAARAWSSRVFWPATACASVCSGDCGVADTAPVLRARRPPPVATRVFGLFDPAGAVWRCGAVTVMSGRVVVGAVVCPNAAPLIP